MKKIYVIDSLNFFQYDTTAVTCNEIVDSVNEWSPVEVITV